MAELHQPHSAREPQPLQVRHETSDANVRGVFGFALGLAIALGVIAFSVFVLFQYFAAREARAVAPTYPLAAAASRLPPEPRLQTNPRQDLIDLRAREDEVLSSYGWVDKNAGVVRIPIEQAMTLTVQRGLPSRSVNEQRP
jgi:hypothetical protein